MATLPRASMIAGRWGTSGDWDDGFHTGVKQIRLKADDAGIRFFQAGYFGHDQASEGPAHGTQGVSVSIELDFPAEEYITNVSGYLKPSDTIVVRSLTFKTNGGISYGPYGGHTPDQDVPFDFPTNSDFRIVGFRGAYGDEFLSAIGVYISR